MTSKTLFLFLLAAICAGLYLLAHDGPRPSFEELKKASQSTERKS